MDQWAIFRRQGKRAEPAQAPRSRGRRRQNLVRAPDDPDAVMTDRDAAHAAETARQARARPQPRAWERFGSEPVVPRRRPADHGDAVLTASRAERDGAAAVMAESGRPAKAGASRDYGTGPAYDAMLRQHPS